MSLTRIPASSPVTTLAELVREMVENDYAAAKRDSMVKQAGYQAYGYHHE